MSNQITVNKDLITESRMNGNNKIVYMYLKLLSNGGDLVPIPLQHIADELFINVNTVKSSIKILREFVYIKVHKQLGNRGSILNAYEIVK